MTLQELMECRIFDVVNEGDDRERQVERVFCCDLLSIAMGRAPEGGAWVTVMANMNTLAVAALTETACVILAEGAQMDEGGVKKAAEQGITVLKTELPVFEAGLLVHRLLEEERGRV